MDFKDMVHIEAESLHQCTVSHPSVKVLNKKKLTESRYQPESETVRGTYTQVIQWILSVIREKGGYTEQSVTHVDDYTFFFDFRNFLCICPFCFRMNRIFNSLHL